MGAESFFTRQKGASAKAAFTEAKRQAREEYGNLGYTGTIAEKESFVMIRDEVLPLDLAEPYAESLVQKGDPRIDDKWGPAGAIDLGGGEYLFFGWASS